ncbi:uncharacterized protein LOC103579857 [Microplitis demolitor]|uniref:uncharacterized protein LOC103579857 n=1 Tax=Microplitis demolitor TaxID=69319 RepID=UPI000440009A|nr:uncharacterized protein LOC103579857 [Microplitis demolitor]
MTAIFFIMKNILIITITILIFKSKNVCGTDSDLSKVTNAIIRLTNLLDEMINHPRPITNTDKNRDKILESFDKIYKLCRNFDDSSINNLGNVFKSKINWYDQTESLKVKLDSSDTKKEKEDAIFFDILELIENKFHNQFMDYLADYDGCNTDTVDRFIGNIIDNKNYQDMIDLINSFTTLTITSQRNDIQNIFGIIVSQLQRKANTFLTCDDVPAYEQLYNLYERILATSSKAYAMLIISFKFRQLRLSNYNLFENEQHVALENFKNSLKEITKSATYYLNSIDNTIYKSYKNCDPEVWQEGKNYIRVKNHVTFHAPERKLQNEYITKNMTNAVKEMECNRVRGYWDPTDSKTGMILSMTCPYIFGDDNRKKNFCPTNAKEIFMFPVHNHLPSGCIDKKVNELDKYCACDLSYDDYDSLRVLSLRQYYTDSALNQVVVGVRWAVKNNIIALELKQGTLVNGVVDPTTVFWNTTFGYPPEDGPDYIKLDYRVKTFNLDDIELPHGQFVTGVKFEILSDKHITLVVRGSTMYNDNKVFRATDNKWHYPKTEDIENSRHNIKLDDFRNSAESTLKNNEMSHSGQHYVRLTPAVYSRVHDNIAVIPFIDSREVSSSPPSPFGGFGLTYKGQLGYGGFIAFKYILSKHNINIDNRILAIN